MANQKDNSDCSPFDLRLDNHPAIHRLWFSLLERVLGNGRVCMFVEVEAGRLEQVETFLLEVFDGRNPDVQIVEGESTIRVEYTSVDPRYKHHTNKLNSQTDSIVDSLPTSPSITSPEENHLSNTNTDDSGVGVAISVGDVVTTTIEDLFKDIDDCVDTTVSTCVKQRYNAIKHLHQIAQNVESETDIRETKLSDVYELVGSKTASGVVSVGVSIPNEGSDTPSIDHVGEIPIDGWSDVDFVINLPTKHPLTVSDFESMISVVREQQKEEIKHMITDLESVVEV